jgi:hypothetical protein
MPMSYRPINQSSLPGSGPQPGSLLRRLREAPQDAVNRIAGDIGTRRATSLGEAQAAAYLDGRLRRAGLRVSADAFRAPAGIAWDGIVLALLATLSVILYYWVPRPSLALSLWNLAIAVAAFRRPSNPFLIRKQPSQNVIATRALEGPPRWRVVLLAPLDTPPATPQIARRLSSGMRPLLGRVVACGAIVALALLAFFGPLDLRRLLWYAQFAPAAYLLIVAALEAWLLWAPATAGAANHAGALAAMLESADILNALTQTELWAVALGASSSGAGLADLLRRYPFDPQMTLFIGLETIGSGLLSYVTREGRLPQRSADPLLVRLVTETDATDPLINVEPRPYYSEPTLQYALHRGRYRTLTIIGLDADGSPAQRGSSTDTPEQIDAEMIDRAVRLIIGVVKQLDTET